MFAFVDRVLDCSPGESVVALKALALNEEFFQDHFPGAPVLPGAMILEGFVQAARHCLEAVGGGGGPWVLHAVENMRFQRFVTPGDTLRLEARRDGEQGGAVWFAGQARCGDDTVCRVRFALRRRSPAD